MIYVLGIMVALILSLGGLTSCQHEKIVSLKSSIEANKVEAARLLTEEKAKGKADAIASQKDYDDALKTLSDANRKYAGQLRDPGRRNSCVATASPVAGVPENTATGSELSQEAGSFLRGEADRADLTAIYAAKCREHALKPSMRDQVNAMRGIK